MPTLDLCDAICPLTMRGNDMRCQRYAHDEKYPVDGKLGKDTTAHRVELPGGIVIYWPNTHGA